MLAQEAMALAAQGWWLEFSPWNLLVVVQMGNVLRKLRSLNTWSLTGGDVEGGH